MAYTFKGFDAARARKLARTKRRPKFTFGDVVIDVHGDIASIDAIFADLAAAEDAGVFGGSARDWLRLQDERPKTPATGIWYSLVFGHGAGIAGENDLKRAPHGATSKPH